MDYTAYQNLINTLQDKLAKLPFDIVSSDTAQLIHDPLQRQFRIIQQQLQLLIKLIDTQAQADKLNYLADKILASYNALLNELNQTSSNKSPYIHNYNQAKLQRLPAKQRLFIYYQYLRSFNQIQHELQKQLAVCQEQDIRINLEKKISLLIERKKKCLLAIEKLEEDMIIRAEKDLF